MLIARKYEIQRLEKVYRSREAELVVLYGRRRVGKTFLIRNFFAQKNCIFFQSTGLQKGLLEKQLNHFAASLSETFTQGIQIKAPKSWDEAFKILTQFIQHSAKNKKKVIFLDELPWMATRKSGLLEALDYYWNHYWSSDSKIILIVCGSSASWLIKNIIYNQGGLHNHCTCEIKLDPFNLIEVSSYLASRKIRLSRHQILELYMALGGIPYYLKYVESGLSAAENIQNILFHAKAPLKDEFTKLFASLFGEAEVYIELIKLIAQKKEGVSRSLLEQLSELSPGGGRLTQRLNHLIQTSFIELYIPWDKKRGEYFKLSDEFCLFYIYWLLSNKTKKFANDYWLKQIKKPIYHVWSGYAFESICHKHVNQMIKALNIKTTENISSWKSIAKKEKEKGAQIDLLFDRGDDAITICEIKYTSEPFKIDKQYYNDLLRKINVFKAKTKTKKQIFVAIISANGLKPSIYSEELISGCVTLDDLFKNSE